MRPFVYSLAARHGVSGWVLNDSRGVEIEAEGRDRSVGSFVRGLQDETPPLAHVTDVTSARIPPTGEAGFESGVTMVLSERDLPVSPAVAAACDMLGLDVLSVANEGKVLLVCPEAPAPRVLDAMRVHPLGREARGIGRVGESRGVGLVLKTGVGGERIVDMPYGEALPRIC